ncbi:MAG: hypothetical protein HC912_02635 [Saprospiraceae bacterium]|nr:hypothetical protein [Saprospiraceae bacterium]
MNAVTIDTSTDRFIVSIDKSLMSRDTFLEFVQGLRLEALAQKVDFGEEIEQIGKEIKSNWWLANKDRFIPKSEQ